MPNPDNSYVNVADAEAWGVEREADIARNAENRVRNEERLLIASPDENRARDLLSQVARAQEMTIAFAESATEAARTFAESATYATGAIPAIAHLFTISETAILIGESYHTTRNRAHAGQFGVLSRRDSNDVTYITREGLLEYLYSEIRESREKHNDLLHRQAELGGVYIITPHTHDGAIVDERQDPADFEDDDVTNEQANLAQAFENVSQAFSAITATLQVNAEQDGTRYEEFRTLIEDLRDAINTREVPASTQSVQAIFEIRQRLAMLESRQITNLQFQLSPPNASAVAPRPLMLTPSPDDFTRLRAMRHAEDAEPPTLPAPPPPTSPPASAPARGELTVTRAPVAESRTPTLIPSDRPDQIVEVSRDQTRVDFRSRVAFDVGDSVSFHDGQIYPTALHDPANRFVGVVTTIRDARPDATEIQRPQSIELNWNSTTEILHPWRSETFRIRVDDRGVATLEESFVDFHPHAVIVSWSTERDNRQRTTVLWRAF